MKAVDFAKVLKEIIKKEVRTVIREELREALGRAPQPSQAPKSTQEMFLAEPKPQPKQTIKALTGNTGLDSILAETANAMRNGTSPVIEDDQSFPSMSEMFTADQAQGFGYMMNQEHDQSAYSAPALNPNDPTAAFMKDYSQVLQKAEAINTRK